ncbi:formate--tetrahydrofolate ligase [Roseomonas alkaliterrae]|uniref:Formate--tetrahydrofolate ligase n=1 Tax=Neoroseomonas alkaliterrae TaxID=1452450 RepID=A0A840XV64_9PROT|nr:formate--tetrahydrofolate ligase [Neoroseomonas alkaliterrae]MBB5690529.1 formate--tetrahydrofolate ligase [Neoroseomonas alkaliterrae]MBR0677324.1 formate--tetrahydrofolate ligase [Neoroseomonas alkaliterrae]
MPTDLEIARAATLKPIRDIAAKAGIPEEALEPYGKYKAKVGLDFIASLEGRPDGALVLVTGINPTPAGEGKTTTTVGLGDALNAIGMKAMIALREPSLGPCFGVKGGATGGGYAQVLPMEDINLHFTGDFHAITSANNLLAAMLDNHVYWGNALGLDARRISWRRALDMNDRALRSVVSSLGGVANGFPREDGFDITVASEVMAVFCLARDLADLQARLGRMIVGQTREGRNVTAADLKADGAMAVLLRDAFAPNLVQTIEGSPALVHGGPFANIAHGCNSVMATRLALKLSDVVVTEAGFGADLGAEKFLDIKCRQAGLKPAACVVVATVRALKMNGGVAKADLAREDVAAVKRGVVNLARHVENIGKFGIPVVVGLNRFTTDTPAEIEAVRAAMRALGTEAILCTHWGDGARGAVDLAHAVRAMIEAGKADFAPLYTDHVSLAGKIETIAREIYRAASVSIPASVAARLKRFEEQGFRDLPVCIAKTQYSFSADPTKLGAPEGHVLPVREVRLSAGAGFVVAVCGDIMTMPGLPRVPAAEGIRLDAGGRIEGLF